jgi:hypothetical protein
LAKQQGLASAGPGGLLKQFTKTVPETALDEEMNEHLGRAKHEKSKDDVSVEVKDGYLTVSAHKEEDKDEKGDDGKFLRRERYQGSRTRSFYVGKGLKNTDVTAKFTDGVLSLTFPKEIKPVEEPQQLVQIEG